MDNRLLGSTQDWNEYDFSIADRRRNADSTVSAAGKLDLEPAKAAEVIDIADRGRLPRDTVERNLDRLRVEQGLNEYDVQMKMDPAVRRFLADPYQRAAVKDDPTITIWDKLIDGIARSTTRFKQSNSGMLLSSNARFLQQLDDLDKRLSDGVDPAVIPDGMDTIGYRWMTPEQRAETRKRLTTAAQSHALDIETQEKIARALPPVDPTVASALQAGSPSEFWYHFSQKPVEFIMTVGAESSVQSLAIAAGVALSGGNPVIGAMVGGAGSYGMEYGSSILESLKSQGVNINDRGSVEAAVRDKNIMKKAAENSHSRAMPIALFDAIAAGRAGSVRSIKGAAGNILEQGALGALGETAAQVSEGKDKLVFGEIAAEFFGEMVTAPIEMSGAVGQAWRAHLQAQEQKTFFEALGRAAESSKLRERLPAKLQELVSELTANGPVENVYIDPRAFVQYFQSKNIDPAKAAREVLGSDGPLQEALASGHDLQIPTGAYAAKLAGTEHNAGLAMDLKFDPTTLSAREAEQVLENAKQMVAKAKEEAQAQKDQGATVGSLVAESLRKAGFEQGTAEALATQMEAFFATQAERSGNKEGAMSLFKQYVLRILGRGDKAGDGQTLDQPAFHGSPHIFEKFSLDFIGKGEGAQVHGWGLYFAKMKNTAKTRYRDRLAPIEIKGIDPAVATQLRQDQNWVNVFMKASSDNERMDLWQSKRDRINQAHLSLLGKIDNKRKLRVPEMSIQHLLMQLDLLKDQVEEMDRVIDDKAIGTVKAERGGRLFEVDIKAHDHELLDLDKLVEDMEGAAQEPLQSFFRLPVVQEAVAEAERYHDPTGRDLYRKLVAFADEGDERIWRPAEGDKSYGSIKTPEEAVSKFMLKHDIKGLQYVGGIDGPSLVVFDDSLIEVKSWEQSPVKNPFTESAVQERVYHGTQRAFKRFNDNKIGANFPGISAGWSFTEDPSSASEYAAAGAMQVGGNANVRPAFIDIRNPYVVEASPGEQSDVMDEAQSRIAELKDQGYDGIIVEVNVEEFLAENPEADPGRIRSSYEFKKWYTVFSSRQVKSAITLDQDQARGRLIKYGDFEYDIQMLETADLSTFLHESGHLYLEILKNLAKDNAQIKADLDTLLKWFGIEKVEDIAVEHHEKFARGIEAYFMEGRAPSISLRSVFARFRAWLMAIYGKLANLDVKLNDDVRAVMDRMFATDYEIEVAKRQNELTPVFTTAEQAGMRPEEFERYLKTIEQANLRAVEELQLEIMQEWSREQKSWWKAQRALVQGELMTEREKQADVIAYHALRFGKTPAGEELPEPIKLDKAGLIDLYGKDSEIVKTLRTLNIYRNEGGVHPDVAAPLFGYRSGDEMIKAVLNARGYLIEVENQTDAAMKDRYGDMLLDGTLPEKAADAVLNDERSKVLHAELKALVKKRNEVAPFVQEERNRQRAETSFGLQMLRGVPPLEIFQEMARMRIGAMQVRSITPNQFMIAARRASTEAVEAAAKNDFITAAAAKQQELFNLEMYRVARNAQEQVKKGVDFARSFGKPGVRKRIGLAGQDYLDQIDAIIDRFDFHPVSSADIDRRSRLQDWIAQKERQGITVDLPDYVIDEANRRHYKTLTLEEFNGVQDALRHINHLARLKNKLLKSKDKRTLQQIADLIDTSIRENAKNIDTRKTGLRLPQDEPMRFIDAWFASHRKLSSYVRQLDGYQDGGPLWTYLLNPLNEASNNEATMIHEAGQKLKVLFEPYASVPDQLKSAMTKMTLGVVGRGMYKKEFVQSVGQSFSKMERIMLALNMGNEDNINRIKTGYSWNDKQINDILDPLTKEDWDFVQGIWDFIESYWPQIEAKEQRVNGIAPEKVIATPVQTRYGEYRGGYFPIKYEDRLAPRAYAHLAKEQADQMMRGAYTQATTRRGHTKERVTNVNMPVRLDFSVIFEHVYQVVHDLAFHEYLIDANRILGHKQVQQAIIEGHGHQVWQQMNKTLEDVAVGEVPAITALDKVLNHLRQGTSIAAMGWSVTTSLLQPLGLSQSIVRVGAPWVFKGVARWAGDAFKLENTVKWVHEKSEFMRNRHSTLSREINEIRNSIQGQTALGVVGDSYFYLIAKMQMVADIPTWVGMYEKQMAAGVPEERAIALADQAVLDSQGGGQVKDLAQIQRGGPLLRIWTNFYSFFNTTYNLTAESIGRTNFKSPGQVAMLAVDLLLLYSVPAMFGFLIKEGLRGDEPPEDLTKRLLQEQASYVLGTMVGVRELSSVMLGYFGYEGPAGTRFFSQTTKLIQQSAQGDVDEALLKALNNTAGVLFHYPASQVQRSVEGYIAWTDGKEGAGPQSVLLGKPQEAR